MATDTKKKPAAKAAAAKPAKAPKPAMTTAAAPKAVEPERHPMHRRREITGTVVSDKMQKTVVVEVDRRVRHGMYAKYVTKSRRFKAHDENNTAKVGDLVKLVETRPVSRDKRWAVLSVLRKAAQTIEVKDL